MNWGSIHSIPIRWSNFRSRLPISCACTKRVRVESATTLEFQFKCAAEYANEQFLFAAQRARVASGRFCRSPTQRIIFPCALDRLLQSGDVMRWNEQGLVGEQVGRAGTGGGD